MEPVPLTAELLLQVLDLLRAGTWKYYRTTQAEVWPDETIGEIESIEIIGNLLRLRLSRYGHNHRRHAMLGELAPAIIEQDLTKARWVNIRDDGRRIEFQDGYNIWDIDSPGGWNDQQGGMERFILKPGQEPPRGPSDYPFDEELGEKCSYPWVPKALLNDNRCLAPATSIVIDPDNPDPDNPMYRCDLHKGRINQTKKGIVA